MKRPITDFGSNINEYIEKLFGKEAVDKYTELTLIDPVQFIRVNTAKTNPGELRDTLLEKYEIETSFVENFDFALMVEKGGQYIGKTVEHICGEYYIQSFSSMLPPLVLNPDENDVVLDLCASPGSKSTELSNLMNNKGTLILNEIQMDRVRTLVFNIDRMTVINAGVLHNRGEWLGRIYNDYFDKVLVDAPCSGLGILQKKSEIGNWWTKEKLSGLAELQYKLLVSAIRMAKTGGEIVYSTCTLTVEENEEVINKILDKYPVELLPITLPLKTDPGMVNYEEKSFHPSLGMGVRLNPWEFNSEGFFIAKLRKTAPTEAAKKQEFQKNRTLFAGMNTLKSNFLYLSEIFGIPEEIFHNFRYIVRANDIFFVDKGWDDSNLDLFVRIGNKFGSFDKNGRIILHTQTAQILAPYFTKSIYDIQSLDELKAYLGGGTFRCKGDGRAQIVIRNRDKILGAAQMNEGTIKSRFPRGKRTQEIIIR
ncbi:MAG: NOL1/NOP2/sun family putative RNA methylase [Ignavibacteriaceae bacterium]